MAYEVLMGLHYLHGFKVVMLDLKYQAGRKITAEANKGWGQPSLVASILGSCWLAVIRQYSVAFTCHCV